MSGIVELLSQLSMYGSIIGKEVLSGLKKVPLISNEFNIVPGTNAERHWEFIGGVQFGKERDAPPSGKDERRQAIQERVERSIRD